MEKGSKKNRRYKKERWCVSVMAICKKCVTVISAETGDCPKCGVDASLSAKVVNLADYRK